MQGILCYHGRNRSGVAPDNVNVETLQTLKDAGVTKISIGIQSFQKKYQHIMGRKAVDPAALSAALDAVLFETVSMDFIFALPEQTYEDLKQDIDMAFGSCRYPVDCSSASFSEFSISALYTK